MTDPARRDLLAAAVMDALAGQRDPWVYARAAALGWADFPQAVARVVRAAEAELRRETQQTFFEEAA